MNEADRKKLIDDYAVKHKRKVRDYRRSLPPRRRVFEYLLDWTQAILFLFGRELKDPMARTRAISSDPAWAIMRLKLWWSRP